MKKEDSKNELVPVIEDNSLSALFDLVTAGEEPKYLSYIPGLFTTASLPFKNVKKTVFVRKGSQGLTLTLTSPLNVPYGRYGRLLLTVLTTHAVLSKEKNVPVMIEYNTLADLLKEMQLPKQRGKEVKELREQMGMNRREFCDYFGIPYRTVQDWEAEKRELPDYLLRLLKYRAEIEKLMKNKEGE